MALDFTDVTGVILAGGRSSRMGRDKATLLVGGSVLYGRILSLFRQLFPAVLISGDRPDLAEAGVGIVPDVYAGSALGGLYSALQAARTPWVFVAACDMPFPDRRIIEAILSRRSGQDLVVPRTDDGLEPLFACYRKTCLPSMQRMLEAGQYRIYDFYDELRARYLEQDELPRGWRRSLLNVNTPEELRSIE